MTQPQTHYTFLGLDLSASPEAIRRELERLAQRADVLAYTAPQESREIWSRIRQVQHDLLSSRERRQAYDLAMLRSGGRQPDVQPAPAAVVPPPTPTPSRRVPPVSARRAETPLMPVAPAAPPPRRVRKRNDRGVLLALGAVVALALLGGVLLAALRTTPSARPLEPGLALLDGPARPGHGYASGERIVLRWTAIPGASRYRLQVATRRSGQSLAGAWAHAQTITTRATSHAITVIGPQSYIWRVRARVHRAWTPYAKPVGFSVQPPHVALPVRLSARRESARVPGPVRLCWAAVPGAIDYRLQVDGMRPLQTTGTCAVARLRAGKHRWRVRAIVRAAGPYVGPPSSGAFTIARKVAPKPRARAAAHAASRAANATHSGGSARTTGAAIAQAQAPRSAIPAGYAVRPNSSAATYRPSAGTQPQIPAPRPPPPPPAPTSSPPGPAPAPSPATRHGFQSPSPSPVVRSAPPVPPGSSSPSWHGGHH